MGLRPALLETHRSTNNRGRRTTASMMNHVAVRPLCELARSSNLDGFAGYPASQSVFLGPAGSSRHR